MARLLFLVLLASLLPWTGGRVAGGEDGQEGEVRALADRARTFAAPSDARGFSFEMTIVALGTPVGRARFEAEAAPLPGATEDTLHWHVRETLEVGEGDDAGRTHVEAWLGGDLGAVRGRWVEGAGPDPRIYDFARTKTGFEVRVSGDGRQPVTKAAEGEPPSLVGLTSLILAARELAPEEGEFEARTFRPDWEYLMAEKPFVPLHLAVGPGRSGESTIYRLEMSSPTDDRGLTLHLEAGSGVLRYAHWHPAGAPAFDLRPRDETPPTPRAEVFDPPPRSPRDAAMQTALSFLTRDADRFAALVDWKQLRENHPGIVRGEVSDEDFRKAILAQFRANVPSPVPGETAREVILGVEDAFQVESRGEDRAVVRLPTTISPMRLTLERRDGVWFLVRLPHE